MHIKKWAIRTGIIIFWMFTFLGCIRFPSYIQSLLTKQKPCLHIFSWPEVLSPETIACFEKESGILIHHHHFTTNEELLSKLFLTKGKGYDLILPSDYMVKKLINENLLQPIDHSHLNFINQINSRLMNQHFDKTNMYSIPYIWEILGFATHKHSVNASTTTWECIYNPTNPNTRISMINDPIEAIDCTSHYLFGHEKTQVNQSEQSAILNALKYQKPFVEAYAGTKGDHLLITNSCSIAVIPTSYALRAQKISPNINFIIPKDYSFLSIENFCIPKSSTNLTAIYQFLNFLYRPETIEIEVKASLNFPAITSSNLNIQNPSLYQHILDTFDKYPGTLYYTRDIMSEPESRALWIRVKTP